MRLAVGVPLMERRLKSLVCSGGTDPRRTLGDTRHADVASVRQCTLLASGGWVHVRHGRRRRGAPLRNLPVVCQHGSVACAARGVGRFRGSVANTHGSDSMRACADDRWRPGVRCFSFLRHARVSTRRSSAVTLIYGPPGARSPLLRAAVCVSSMEPSRQQLAPST